jgi:acyl-CoA reductase-like NAD-dependent aldehyde dehydrogenase
LPYCWKCGAKLEEKDAYCTVCGAEVAKIVSEEFSVNTADLVEKVKQLLHEGNVTRVIVKDEKGKILLEIPATVGVVGAILIPWLAALGVIAALATRCTIVVERKE